MNNELNQLWTVLPKIYFFWSGTRGPLALGGPWSLSTLSTLLLRHWCHPNAIAASSKKDKDGNSIMKPTCVLEYNKCMGGVDLVDQQLDSLLVIRKYYKWYKKVFFRLLLQCMLNAHKLMQRQGKQDFLKFLHDAVTQMVAISPRVLRSTSGLDSIARLTGRNHYPSKRSYAGAGRPASTPPSRKSAAYAWHVAGEPISLLPSKQLGFVRPARQYLVCVWTPVVSEITTSNSTTRSRPDWQRSRFMCDVGLIMRVQFYLALFQ